MPHAHACPAAGQLVTVMSSQGFLSVMHNKVQTLGTGDQKQRQKGVIGAVDVICYVSSDLIFIQS